MKKILLSILIVVSPVFAMKEYYGLSRSLRALGMGGAFYGLSNDEYALFYNPAGLSLYEGRPKGMLNINGQIGSRTLSALKTKDSISSSFDQQTVDALAQFQGDPIYAGAGLMPYYLMKHLAVGVLLSDVKADYLLSGKELDSQVDFTGIVDSGLLVGYGRSLINENLHVGVTAKGLARVGGRTSFTMAQLIQGDKVKLNPNDLGGAGFGIDFDLGAIYDIPYLPFGEANRVSLVINNLLATQFTMGSSSTGKPPGLVRTVSLGWHSVFSGRDIVDHVNVMADLAEFQIGGESDPEYGARTGKFLKHLNLGVEVPVGVLTLRTGLHQGYFTAGIGLNLTYFKLELATYGEELASGPGRLPSRRYGLTIALGAGTPNKPFKPTLKGKKVEKGSEEIEFKIKPKAPVAPKIDPALEISPSEPEKSGVAPKAKPETKTEVKPETKSETKTKNEKL